MRFAGIVFGAAFTLVVAQQVHAGKHAEAHPIERKGQRTVLLTHPKDGIRLGEFLEELGVAVPIQEHSSIPLSSKAQIYLDLQDGALVRLKVPIRRDSALHAEKQSTGVWSYRILEEGFVTYTQVLRGTLERTGQKNWALLFQGESHLPSSEVRELAGRLGREVFPHMEQGSRSRVQILYERDVYWDRSTRERRILAVRAQERGIVHEAWWHEGERGGEQFYTSEGWLVGTERFAPPLRRIRINSAFSPLRRHPVHGRWAAHEGVDYQARTGEPVFASAAGRVLRAGWANNYGKLVEIEHSGGVRTRYAHLSKIPSDVRKGAHLKQGQLLGYTGETGQATGPHLHFEVHRKNKVLNPALVISKVPARLPDAELRTFQQRMRSYQREFELRQHGHEWVEPEEAEE